MESIFIGNKLHLFIVLEVSMLCAMIEAEIISKKTIVPDTDFPSEKSIFRHALQRHVHFSQPCDLLWDACFPAFAMGMFSHGYGIVHLKAFGVFENGLRRLKYVTVRVWRHVGYLQLLPWLYKVSMHLELSAIKMYAYYHDPNYYEAENFQSLLVCSMLLWTFQLACILCVLLNSALCYDTLRTGRFLVTIDNHDFRAYVRALNRLLGWEVVPD